MVYAKIFSLFPKLIKYVHAQPKIPFSPLALLVKERTFGITRIHPPIVQKHDKGAIAKRR